MKQVAVLLWVGCACAFAVSNFKSGANQTDQHNSEVPKKVSVQPHNWLINQAINTIVNQAINYIRLIVNNGSDVFGIPRLDPLTLEHCHFKMPAGIINLDMELIDVYATGFGGFETERTSLDIASLAFELDISVPKIEIRSKFEMTGDLLTDIPLYGKGEAEFNIESFRLHALLYLKQSGEKDSNAVIIDRTKDIYFEIPRFHSNLTGMMGGDDIDVIVNTFIEEMLTDYVNRFRGAINVIAGRVVVAVLNPVLSQLDTWKYLAPFVPSQPKT